MKTPVVFSALTSIVALALFTGVPSSSLSAGEPVALFAGEDLSAWTMDKPGAWIARDGELQPASEGAGGYLWTKEKFEDFRLSLEFRMSENCNSGVFFRTDPKNPVQGGFEIQVFDSAGREKVGTHDCGAFYDAVAPRVNAAKPAGEWNTMTITAKGALLTVELNGEVVVDANIDDWTEANRNPDGTKNKFKTALRDLPRNNHIGLQYHGHPVWFRKVMVERL